MIPDDSEQAPEPAAFVHGNIYAADHHPSSEGRHVGDQVVDVRKVPGFASSRPKVSFHRGFIGPDGLKWPYAAVREQMGSDAEIVMQVLAAQNGQAGSH